MRTVEHEVYTIGKTTLDRAEIQRWLTDLGVSEDTQEKLLTQENTDAENLVRLLGKRCYMAFEVGPNPNILKVREDIAEYVYLCLLRTMIEDGEATIERRIGEEKVQ